MVLKWLRKQCSHSAQGLAPLASAAATAAAPPFPILLPRRLSVSRAPHAPLPSAACPVPGGSASCDWNRYGSSVATRNGRTASAAAPSSQNPIWLSLRNSSRRPLHAPPPSTAASATTPLPPIRLERRSSVFSLSHASNANTSAAAPPASEPGGSACCYWNGYGTQRSHPAHGPTLSDHVPFEVQRLQPVAPTPVPPPPCPQAGWVSMLQLESLRNAVQPPGSRTHLSPNSLWPRFNVVSKLHAPPARADATAAAPLK